MFFFHSSFVQVELYMMEKKELVSDLYLKTKKQSIKVFYIKLMFYQKIFVISNIPNYLGLSQYFLKEKQDFFLLSFDSHSH